LVQGAAPPPQRQQQRRQQGTWGISFWLQQHSTLVVSALCCTCQDRYLAPRYGGNMCAEVNCGSSAQHWCSGQWWCVLIAAAVNVSVN
jgi:hypothetical protein